MGAINKHTNKYVLPVNATKKTKYKCPVCDSDILFKSGKKRMKHFCHKAKSKCSYYNERSNENPIHIEGKRLMKKLLDDKQKLFIWRKCECCQEEEEVLTLDCYTDKMVSGEEHYFKHGEKKCFADVALIDDNETYFVFEIKNTHATDEDRRPSDKWCEIDAEDFINNYANRRNVCDEIEIECVRDIRCNDCEVKMEKKKEEEQEQEQEQEQDPLSLAEEERATRAKERRKRKAAEGVMADECAKVCENLRPVRQVGPPVWSEEQWREWKERERERKRERERDAAAMEIYCRKERDRERDRERKKRGWYYGVDGLVLV
tara:strand:- start:38 stop:991 length:954 start_codon:yes stop_codon:yes gene_type:complete